MVKHLFYFIIFTLAFLLKLCHSSTTCKFCFFPISHSFTDAQDFVSQNGTTNADGSEAYPYSDMQTSVDSANDSDLTLVLFSSVVPYEFFEIFYSDLNLIIT